MKRNPQLLPDAMMRFVFNKEQKVQGSDTTMFNSSTKAK